MKNVGKTLDSREPGVTNWPETKLHLVSHHWLGIGMWGYTPVGLTGVLVIYSPMLFAHVMSTKIVKAHCLPYDLQKSSFSYRHPMDCEAQLA